LIAFFDIGVNSGQQGCELLSRYHKAFRCVGFQMLRPPREISRLSCKWCKKARDFNQICAKSRSFWFIFTPFSPVSTGRLCTAVSSCAASGRPALALSADARP
jgi:hypothetical protein